jgi:YgiT-type zinc finger domain-containing protein
MSPHAAPLCPLCGGDLVPGRITSTVDRDGCLLVVRGVSATVCDQCGKEWLADATVVELQRLAEDARRRGAVVEILQMAS